MRKTDIKDLLNHEFLQLLLELLDGVCCAIQPRRKVHYAIRVHSKYFPNCGAGKQDEEKLFPDSSEQGRNPSSLEIELAKRQVSIIFRTPVVTSLNQEISAKKNIGTC